MFERVSLAANVEIAIQGGEPQGSATLGDISKSGIRLKMSSPVEMDSVLSLKVHFFDHQVQVSESMIGRVVRCDPAGAEGYDIGVQFIQPIHPRKAPFLHAYVAR